MLFSAENLTRSVIACLSAEVASRIADASPFTPSRRAGYFDEDEIGRLLALSMGPSVADLAPILDKLCLSVVQFNVAGEPAMITGADARMHPVLGPWCAVRFDQCIGDAIRTGTQLTGLAPGAPAFARFELIEIVGMITAAMALLQFPGGRSAILNFGDPFGMHAPAYVAHSLSGPALNALGQSLRPHPFLPDEPSDRPPADDIGVPQTVH
jgi:hypothetical protein